MTIPSRIQATIVRMGPRQSIITSCRFHRKRSTCPEILSRPCVYEVRRESAATSRFVQVAPDDDGGAGGKSKAQDWKACYHNARAMLNVADSLRRLGQEQK